MKIYLATSWKNEHYERVLNLLTNDGHDVYDFRKDGFHWSKVGLDTNGEWSIIDYLYSLEEPEAYKGFRRDVEALATANVCVMLLPCGNSSHLEAGYKVGRGGKLVIYIDENDPGFRPDLMYKWANSFVTSDDELLKELHRLSKSKLSSWITCECGRHYTEDDEPCNHPNNPSIKMTIVSMDGEPV